MLAVLLGAFGGEASGGLLPEVVRLQKLDRTLNKLREFKQRWDDRLSLKVASLGKRYLEGRLSVICYASRNAEGGEIDPPSGLYNGRAIDDLVAVVIHSADPTQSVDGERGDQELVFVDVVELTDLPKKVAPSSIGAYLVLIIRDTHPSQS